LVPLEERRLEGPFSISRHLHRRNSCAKGADSRGELTFVTSVPVPAPIVGLLARFGLQMFGHLGLQNLVEDRLQQRRQSAVAVQQVLDLLVVNRNLKGGHR
jgi:hypothetical protein